MPQEISGAFNMKNKWQIYQELELIPDSIPAPQATEKTLVRPLAEVWRSLINRLTKNLSYQQKIERLEKCLARDCVQHPNGWQKLWLFLNQPIMKSSLSHFSEPLVWKTSDNGQTWWHICEPLTGEQFVLDSEEEVRIWLDEHRP